ncbi:MAG: lipid II flippase MurJ [Hydrogenophaga sp.]|uniref:lipid II flippase MurJ n=1 Tax=Hydrogenophaga sp. TaxID=1904254 RepID=UPI002ABC6261|nr:lipid II flippase MurJ [Hydrogenophaga sp.]MDZ4281978.1 lipid II flippase MurJ [Hydrogenophaga sp.]
MKRQLTVIALLTAASQLAAFFKLWFTARLFGVGSELDGYNLALVLPSLVSGVLLGFLQTGLFPVRARLNARAPLQETERFERAVLWSSFFLGILATMLIVVSSTWLTPKLGGSAPPSVISALAFALPMTAPLVALNMLGDCAGYLLAMRGRFAIAAGAPIVNGMVGGLLLATWPEGGLLNLVLGTLLGLLAQVGICLYGLSKTGFIVFGTVAKWQQASRLMYDIARLGGWVLPGVIFSNLIVSLPPIWMTAYGEGAVSAFGYAYRLHSSAVQLLIMASSTVILANFSDLVAQKNESAIRRLLYKAGWISLLLGLISTVAVWLLGDVILEHLFAGRFDAAAATRVATHWLWLTAGLGFAILGNVFAKLWQARAKPKLMSIFAFLSLLTMATTFWLIRNLLGEFALGAALSVSSITVVFLGVQYLKQPIRENRY